MAWKKITNKKLDMLIRFRTKEACFVNNKANETKTAKSSVILTELFFSFSTTTCFSTSGFGFVTEPLKTDFIILKSFSIGDDKSGIISCNLIYQSHNMVLSRYLKQYK